MNIKQAIAHKYGDLALCHVSKAIGITQPTLAKAIEDPERLNINSARIILSGLGLTFSEVFDKKQLVPERCPVCVAGQSARQVLNGEVLNLSEEELIAEGVAQATRPGFSEFRHGAGSLP